NSLRATYWLGPFQSTWTSIFSGMNSSVMSRQLDGWLAKTGWPDGCSLKILLKRCKPLLRIVEPLASASHRLIRTLVLSWSFIQEIQERTIRCIGTRGSIFSLDMLLLVNFVFQMLLKSR